MKKITTYILLLVTAFFFTVTPAHAFEMRGGEHIIVGEQEVVNGTLFAGGNTIEINGHVMGDVICGGQKITVNAIVDGDVICGGQTVTINGDVVGNTRVAGQTVMIDGVVERNITAAGQDITIGSESSVGSDVFFVGQTATINGIVGRDVGGATQTLLVNGQVNRSINAQSSSINIGPTADIKGDFSYTSGKKASIDPSAIIGGATEFHLDEQFNEPKKDMKKMDADWIGKWFSPGRFMSILFYTLLAIVFITLFPSIGKQVVETMELHPVRSTGIGILSMIVLPVVILAFMITIIGIPVAILIAAFYAFAFLVGRMCSGYIIGKRVLRQVKEKGTIKRIWPAVVGIPLVLILFGIPYVGWIISLIFTMWGVGGIMLSFAEKRKK